MSIGEILQEEKEKQEMRVQVIETLEYPSLCLCVLKESFLSMLSGVSLFLSLCCAWWGFEFSSVVFLFLLCLLGRVLLWYVFVELARIMANSPVTTVLVTETHIYWLM
jgi:hypothetical protein